MPERIDLRSDTVTVPSPEMRRAIAEAPVGDDVWGEDPTVIELQRRVSEDLGMEDALFVPSGTMANQISLLVHTRPGEEVLLGWGSHCTSFEAGAGAAWAGVQFQAIGSEGLFTADEVLEAIHPADVHLPPSILVWIENTHNRAGGRIWPQAQVEAVARAARGRGLRVHIDGARLLNAAVATRRPPRELASVADSTSICLSKGLGCPVGSVLAGSSLFVKRARRFRKMLGGGLRQVGILAAAGLYALDHNVERLAEDHANAQLLARGLAEVKGVHVDPARVQTNIVIFDVDGSGPDAGAFISGCAARGLLFSQVGPRRVRAVTHLDLGREACQAAVRIVREQLA